MPVATIPIRAVDDRSRYVAEQVRDFNDISHDLPDPNTSKERKACDKSLSKFLKTCFPRVFPLAWSPDHKRLIEGIEHNIKHGGLKAIAYPRGSGKTSIMIHAAIWAVLTGQRRYVCIVTADEISSTSVLSTIKTQINFSEELLELYGRELHCQRRLSGEAKRCLGQHNNGRKTKPIIGPRMLGIGTVGDCVSDGAVITTCGITGRIRGQQHTTMEGETIRPDFLLVDDPQTKGSAASPSQVQTRIETLNGDCLGLAGPGVKISGFCTATVIYHDDLASRLLDRSISPDWNADKVSMITNWPKNLQFWDQYNEIRVDEIDIGKGHKRSLDFYKKNRKKMDEGAGVYWEQRKSKTDVSALQHAMDLYYRDPLTFASEFQNAPLEHNGGSPYLLSAKEIARRTTGLPRGVVPNSVDKLVAFVDTQKELFYYAIVAWTNEGRSYVIDYGSCPDQKRLHWSKLDIAKSLQSEFGEDFETCIRSGLTWLTTAILETEYVTEDGASIFVDKLAIDARWGLSTEIIRQWVRESKHRNRIHPSMGKYIGPNAKDWQKIGTNARDKDGVRVALMTPKKVARGGRREMIYDSNYWKSYLAERLMANQESPTAMVFFDAPPHQHRMIAEHCYAEEPFRVINKAGKEMIEWRVRRQGLSDNDFWDCLVGCCALGSITGAETHVGNRKAIGARNKQLDTVLDKKRKAQFFKSRSI